LLFIGRLAPSKRVGVVIEALARLREPSVHLAIIGDQSDLYELEAARCRALADQLGVNDRVHFLGRVSDRDLPGIYRCADLFVTASRHEGFCLPVVEAMASGLPVVAARAGALLETVGAGGLLFSPDDADELAQGCRTLLIEDPAFYSILRERAPMEAARHGRPAWRQKFAELIEHVLDTSPRSYRQTIRLSPLPGQQAAWRNQKGIAVAVRVTNEGTHAVWSEALASPVIRAEIEPRTEALAQSTTFSVPGLLVPQETKTLLLSVSASETLKDRQVKLCVVSRSGPCDDALDSDEAGAIMVPIIDKTKSALGAALAEAHRVHVLPEGYHDTSTGPFAFVKRWLKRKLLGRFQRNYVDVLSRRQTAFNREILSVLAELTALCNERQADSGRLIPGLPQDVLGQLDSISRRLSALEERLTHLERVRSGEPL
jgi:hypothetical protein